MKEKFFLRLVAGYPDFDTCFEIMNLCSELKVDALEILMPFSDPASDCSIVKKASVQCLKNGFSVQNSLDLIKKFKGNCALYWVGYFNSIYNYGIEKFFNALEEYGAKGVMIFDLPFEEFKRLPKTNLDIIRTITPKSDTQRIKSMLKSATGYVYCAMASDDKIKEIKTIKNLPVISGLNTNAHPDGKIAHFEVAKIIRENSSKEVMLSKIKEFILSNKG
ncbi:tryptophan synthase subunit alpha [bacterium]|nr:tryptophan synthase subunit alpha [bacterium]